MVSNGTLPNRGSPKRHSVDGSPLPAFITSPLPRRPRPTTTLASRLQTHTPSGLSTLPWAFLYTYSDDNTHFASITSPTCPLFHSSSRTNIAIVTSVVVVVILGVMWVVRKLRIDEIRRKREFGSYKGGRRGRQ